MADSRAPIVVGIRQTSSAINTVIVIGALAIFGGIFAKSMNIAFLVALAFAVLHITGSTVALGEVIAARVAATLVFLLVGGVTGDRLPRVVVIQTCHVISALTQGLAAYLVISGRATVPTILALEAITER